MLMMARCFPPCDLGLLHVALIERAASRMHRNVPLKLTSTTSFHSPLFIFRIVRSRVTPALLIRTSRCPQRTTIPSIIWRTLRESRTSQANSSASLLPASKIYWTTASALDCSLWKLTPTAYPARPNAKANSRPMPRDAPVIKTVFTVVVRIILIRPPWQGARRAPLQHPGRRQDHFRFRTPDPGSWTDRPRRPGL